MPVLIHVCLVSDQTLQNLIPALMYQPNVVHLLISERMRGKAAYLQNVLDQRGIQWIPHNDVPTAGLHEVEDYAENVLIPALRQAHGETVQMVLNCTCGTKLMSQGFIRTFEKHWPTAEILYTDTEHNKIEFFAPPDKQPDDMQHVLDLHTYLAGQGFTIKSVQSAEPSWREKINQRADLTYWLAQKSAKLGGFFSAMNWLASQALDKEILKEPRQRFRKIQPSWPLAKIATEGLLNWADGSLDIQFQDADAALYLNGFWLEEYAWLVLNKLALKDVQVGTQGEWAVPPQQGAAPRNEFDALAVHRNRLLMIECKTSRFGKFVEKDQGIITKLDSLGRNTGGLFGKGLLLSALPLNDPSLHNRAKQQGITIIEAQELPHLKKHVQDWMDNLS